MEPKELEEEATNDGDAIEDAIARKEREREKEKKRDDCF